MNWLYKSADLAFKAAYFVWSNRMAVIRCFWPMVVLYSVFVSVSAVFLGTENSGHTPKVAGGALLLLFLVYVPLIYGLVMQASCAIRWHRFVQLGEEPGWSTLALSHGTKRYFWHGILFSLILGLFILPAIFVGIWLVTSSPDGLHTRPRIEDLPAGELVGIMLLEAVCALLMLLFLARRLLVFPHIAVDPQKFAALRQRLAYPAPFVGAMILGWVLYRALYFVSEVMFPLRWLITEHLGVTLVFGVFGVVIGQYFVAWVITVMSMEYRTQLHNLGLA